MNSFLVRCVVNRFTLRRLGPCFNRIVGKKLLFLHNFINPNTTIYARQTNTIYGTAFNAAIM